MWFSVRQPCEEQRLVYLGRLLQDHLQLEDVLRKVTEDTGCLLLHDTFCTSHTWPSIGVFKATPGQWDQVRFHCIYIKYILTPPWISALWACFILYRSQFQTKVWLHPIFSWGLIVPNVKKCCASHRLKNWCCLRSVRAWISSILTYCLLRESDSTYNFHWSLNWASQWTWHTGSRPLTCQCESVTMTL